MNYHSHVWSVIIHGVLAVMWYWYSHFIMKFVDTLNQVWVVDTLVFLGSIALFAFLYKKFLPKKYELSIGWLAGFFPVLAFIMFLIY
ncbi:hypothetical protein EDD68_1039 [Melghiribacillus thermohalophilus]|uniref:Uncharacterized protein n=1 Tax=Melghiribacillus thermohalophilus TaxID=1324956 RepID=A0A4R3N9M6_9BACI|nr:hypothetical protein [Melghiribacillus thermohalophilus]TCT25457.1 hypothetical protein EDD68_1039 [Melghiribacillus thermohalophilus]